MTDIKVMQFQGKRYNQELVNIYGLQGPEVEVSITDLAIDAELLPTYENNDKLTVKKPIVIEHCGKLVLLLGKELLKPDTLVFKANLITKPRLKKALIIDPSEFPEPPVEEKPIEKQHRHHHATRRSSQFRKRHFPR